MTSQTTVPASTKAPMNVLAVVGFVLSLVGFSVISIVLGAIALSQIKRKGERGRGFALAAIWIGVLATIIWIVMFVTLVTASMNGVPIKG